MSRQITILSTALLESRLVDEAAAAGVVIDVQPFIEVSLLPDGDVKEEISDMADLPVTAVFTSAKAVEAVSAVLGDKQADWEIYCIGAATARVVAERFGEEAIIDVGNDAGALAEVIIADDVCEVVFFCGDKRRDTLPDALRREDVSVHEMVVYHTSETPVKTRADYDGILFFSPSAVSSYFSVNAARQGQVFFAIGNTTAGAVEQHSGRRPLVGDAHSKESLVKEAIAYYKNQVAGDSGQA